MENREKKLILSLMDKKCSYLIWLLNTSVRKQLE